MCVNGLLVIICELIWIKIKLTAFFSVGKKAAGAYDNIKIKQYLNVGYLVWCLDAKLSGKSMAMKSLWKINVKLQFLLGQMSFYIQN